MGKKVPWLFYSKVAIDKANAKSIKDHRVRVRSIVYSYTNSLGEEYRKSIEIKMSDDDGGAPPMPPLKTTHEEFLKWKEDKNYYS